MTFVNRNFKGIQKLSPNKWRSPQPALSRLIAVLSTPANRIVLHEAITELAGQAGKAFALAGE